MSSLPLSKYLDPIIINQTISDDFREKIVRQALGYRRKKSSPSNDELSKLIQQKIVVDGFRPGKAHEAGVGRLLRPMVTRFCEHGEAVSAILKVWVEMHTDLFNSLSEYLVLNGTPIADDVDLDLGFQSYSPLSEVMETSEAFIVQFSQFDVDDAALMLCCLTGQAPIPDEAIEKLEREIAMEAEKPEVITEEATTSGRFEVGEPRLDEWLRDLSGLPCDSSVWSKVEQFVGAVNQITGEKQKEKRELQEAEARAKEVEKKRAAIEKAIADLVQETLGESDYLELKEVPKWSESNCRVEDLDTVAENLPRLLELLNKHRELRLQPIQTRAEEHQRRQQLDLFANEVDSIYHQISQFFGTSGGTSDQALEIEEEQLVENHQQSSVNILPERDTKVESSTQDRDVRESKNEEKASSAVITQEAGQIAPEDSKEPLSETEEKPAYVDEELFPRGDTDIDTSSLVEAENAGEFIEKTKVDTREPVTSEEEEQPDDEHVGGGLEEVHQTLRSVKEIAEILTRDDREENWQGLVWAMIAEADITGAFWLATSLEASGIGSPVPPWLLKVVQGSRWLEPNSDAFTGELLQIMEEHQELSDYSLQLIGLSAALLPSLISPYSGLIGLLNSQIAVPPMHSLVTAIREFASLNIALSEEDVRGVAGAEERRKLIVEASHAAQIFLETAPARKTKYFYASDIWRNMVGHDGELRKILVIAAEDRRSDFNFIEEYLDQCDQYDFIDNRIDEIDRELHKIKTHKIEGSARDQLYRYIDEAISIARIWYRLVDNERKIETRGSWFFEQISLLRQSVQDCLPEMRTFVEGLTDQSNPLLKSLAAGKCLMYSIHRLETILDLNQSASFQDELIGFPNWDWLKVNKGNLAESLAGRLLLLPDLQLSDDGQPDPDDLTRIAKFLLDSLVENRTPEDAFKVWLDLQDYRFINRLLTSFQDPIVHSEAKHRFQDTLSGSRAALLEQKASTESVIEQAVIDGLIVDERSEHVAAVETVIPEIVQNFPAKYKVLKDVRQSLADARQNRIAYLEDLWKDLRPKLETSTIPSERQAVISGLITDAFERRDSRVGEEYLSRLAEIIDAGSDLSEEWFQPRVERDSLMDYIASAPEIEKWLEAGKGLKNTIEDIREGYQRAGIRFGDVPPKRREEAIAAIQAWRRIKQQGSDGPNNPNAISAILNHLGFHFDPSRARPVEVEKTGKDWVYYRVSMSASEFARPIPQFGSLAGGIYHLICLWERPGMDTIAARLMELRLKLKTVLVFYLGRLTPRQRYDLIRVSKDQDLALPVLDETLLVSLAQERDIRLPTFLRCALPFTTLNPYTPFQAGDVPPEIFYGRSSLLSELQRQQGSCLVYGGRQLGKSALLRHVQRDFDNRPLGQFAQVEDIKLVGDPAAGLTTYTIWRKLRDCFREFGLISGRISTEKPDELERHIREVFTRRPDIRVLILFDEADNFLNSDAKDNFRVTERLRTLMVDTERRFKVVFAGLHNVQRFQGIPNQPLAHFGTPICIGPLEPEAAQQLICQPLEYLGYRFTDNSGPLRILSYTNYHPGLIQLFCQDLLSRLRNRTGNGRPPFRIEQTDIEAVYRHERDRIKERFDWTLALDSRYQAVAWSLVVDQLDMKDSFARGYPPGEILRLVREWWPQGFTGADIAETRGCLDEMVGLGVLIRDSQGLYRLRSPNLVRLMGTETDIETQLLELTEKQPEVTFEADYHHAPLDEKAQTYSPLTYAQERSLNVAKPGVGFVFASEALGASSVVRAFEKFVPQEGISIGNCEDIPLWISSNSDLQNWLDRHIRVHSEKEHIVVYQYIPQSRPEELIDIVEGALDFTSRRQTRRQNLRVLFVFDSQTAWDWLSLPSDQREDFENRADASVVLRRWNSVGIRQRLAQLEKLHSPKVVQAIMDTTGGWPCLLDNLFERCGAKDDPRVFAEEIEKELSDPESEFHQWFRSSLGIESLPFTQPMLTFFLQGDQVPLDYVTPELVGIDLGLPAEQYLNAIEYFHRLNLIDMNEGLVSVDRVIKKVLQNQ